MFIKCARTGEPARNGQIITYLNRSATASAAAASAVAHPHELASMQIRTHATHVASVYKTIRYGVACVLNCARRIVEPGRRCRCRRRGWHMARSAAQRG